MLKHDARQEKKETIFRAALEAYAKYGIHAATAKQIAEIANIGKSTIFEYFRSTEELMDASFAWYIGQANAKWDSLHIIALTDPAYALLRYFDDLIELITSVPEKLLLISQYSTTIIASSSNFIEVKMKYSQKLQSSADKLMEEFKFIADRGITSGIFNPKNMGAADCALMINSIVREMQAQAFVQELSQIKETCNQLKRLAFNILGADTNIENCN